MGERVRAQNNLNRHLLQGFGWTICKVISELLSCRLFRSEKQSTLKACFAQAWPAPKREGLCPDGQCTLPPLLPLQRQASNRACHSSPRPPPALSQPCAGHRVGCAWTDRSLSVRSLAAHSTRPQTPAPPTLCLRADSPHSRLYPTETKARFYIHMGKQHAGITRKTLKKENQRDEPQERLKHTTERPEFQLCGTGA